MSQTAEIVLHVDPDGKLDPRQGAFIRALLKQYAGGDCLAKFGPPKRSLSQLRFLFGYLYPAIHRSALQAGIGCTINGLHAHYKNKFLPRGIETVFGQEVVTDPTTTDMSRRDFSEFVNNILSDDRTVQLLAQAGEFLDDVAAYEKKHGKKVVQGG